LAITQTHNISALLDKPLDQPYNMRNRAGSFIPEIDFFGHIDMTKLDITQIDNVDNPDQVALEVEEILPDVLLIDYYMTPWTGDVLLSAITNRAKKTKFKRPKYIIGIAEAQFLNREIMEQGADGFIKKQMLHGWDQWPKEWPAGFNTSERVLTTETSEYSEANEKGKERFRKYLKEIKETGELDQFDDILGFKDFILNPKHEEAMSGVRGGVFEREKIFYDFLGYGVNATHRNGTVIEEPVEGHFYGPKRRILPNGTSELVKEDKALSARTPQEALANLEKKLFGDDREKSDEEIDEEMRRRAEEEEEKIRRKKEQEEKEREKEEQYKYYP